MTRQRDAVVVGGGIVGCAVARALAPDRDVLVLDSGPIPGGATRRAAGLVTVSSVYADRPAVADHARRFLRTYDGRRGVRFREGPSLELLAEGEVDLARRRVERLREAGGAVEFLDAEALAARYPRIDSAAGAVSHGRAGTVDPVALAAALRADAAAAGATFRPNAAVDAVEASGGTVEGVRVDGRLVPAPTVVAAAGWRTGRLLRASGVDRGLPVRPYRTFCARLRAGRPLPAGFPTGALPEEGPYFRPAPGGDLLAGGWAVPVEDDPDGPGTAGGDARRRATEAFRERALSGVRASFDGFDGARVVHAWSGVDGATPDGRPIVDSPGAPDGLVVATGFHGKGVMTAPTAAALVRRIVLGDDAGAAPLPGGAGDGGAPPDAGAVPREPFALERFGEAGPEFGFDSVGLDSDADAAFGADGR